MSQATIMPRREFSVTGCLKAIVAALASLMLAACADTQLDRIYIESLHYQRELGRQESREFNSWLIENEKWKRGELGPDAPQPVRPELSSGRWPYAARMRFMERELVALLSTRCPNRGAACVVQELSRLDFACNDATPIACTLNNAAYADYYTPFTRHREYHAWTITVARDDLNPSVQAHVELSPNNR